MDTIRFYARLYEKEHRKLLMTLRRENSLNIFFVAGLPSNPITATLSGGQMSFNTGFTQSSTAIGLSIWRRWVIYRWVWWITRRSKDRMIGYLGIISGAGGAAAITKVSKISLKVIRKSLLQLLRKKMWYPIAKVGAFLGWKITKMSVGKTVTGYSGHRRCVLWRIDFCISNASAERLANALKFIKKANLSKKTSFYYQWSVGWF